MPMHPNSEVSGLSLPLGCHVDVYFPSCKRSRVSAPFISPAAMLQKPRTTIEDLPDECIFEIFRRLQGNEEKSSCASVSKRWLMLLSNIRKDEICRDIDFDDDEGCLVRCLKGKKATDVRLAAIAVCAGSRGGLGELSVCGSNPSRGVTDFGLKAIARGCPNLRTLSLWNLSSVGNEGLVEIANECRLLEKLDLCRCPEVSDMSLLAIAENCPNLTTLEIESCSNIGNRGLWAVGRSCRKLKSVLIRNCSGVGDRGVTSLVSSTSCSLKNITLQALNIGDVSLAVIGHYGISVTDLTLSRLRNVTERGFWAMGKGRGLQKLRSLTITSCSGITDLGLDTIGKGCPNLKKFSLRKSTSVSDTGLVSFANAAISLDSVVLDECHNVTLLGIFGMLVKNGKLKWLSLANCLGIKDMALQIPLPPFKTLTSLSVRNCSGFGDISLGLFGLHCPKLQHVEFNGLHGITDDGFTALIQCSEAGLTKVNLSGCVNLTNRVVSSICKVHGGMLEELNLSGCRSITDESIAAIADDCLVLSELDVSKCTITDSGIRILAHAIQLDLRILSISDCCLISNKCLPFLLKMSKSLVGLNIQRCHGISSRTVSLMVNRMWKCDVLS